MDDLSGLDWNSIPSIVHQNGIASQQKPFRPTPSPILSRGSTPLPAEISGNGPQRPSATPLNGGRSHANDSFSNLLSPQPSRPAVSQSLQEKQKQLLAERNQAQQRQDPYKADDVTFWEGLGSGRGTPVPVRPIPSAMPCSTMSNHLIF